MEGHKHFSHPHKLSFHKSFEGAKLTCNGCNFPCTGTPVYSCRLCKFFLHERCFNATRSLIHPSHPDHPLSLFPSSTYTSGSFCCASCKKLGSGFCFCCSPCQFDLHIDCAYNDLNPKPTSNPTPNQVKLKSHPSHLLTKHRQVKKSTHLCNVCCNPFVPGTEVYRCDICDYDAHVGCTRLPETVSQEGHEHMLSLLYVNPHPLFRCDVCGTLIKQKNCIYKCTSGCDYGIHVACVIVKVPEEEPMDEQTFQLEMLKLQNKMKEHQMAVDTLVSGSQGFHCNC